MAGTVTTTEVTFSSPKKITFDWLSSAGGAADATTVNSYGGGVLLVAFVPDSGGTQPDDNYTVVLKNPDGIDLLAGQAVANRDDTATQYLTSGMGALAAEKLTLGVTSAGSANGGTVIVYLR